MKLAFAVLFAGCWVAAAPQARAHDPRPTLPASLTLPPHPRLLFSASEVRTIKERIARTDWAKNVFEALKKRGDRWLERAVRLPARGSQWYHWYACPKHGTRLQTETPTRHVCPTGKEVYSGYPYDDVVLDKEHDGLANATRDLGLLYHLTGDARYAARAREILLAYADRYLSYPLHDKHNKPNVGGGRVGPQTLDESTWLISMAQGADAVWPTLTPEQKETLKTKLFLPAVAVIRQHKMGIHNIQCWKNSAVGLVGLLLGDAALVADAIDSAHGFRAQMARGVGADGAWYEGAWGYHFYTIDALRPLAEAAFRCGITLYNDAYKKMFLAPLEFAMPDGKLPAFNDSGTASAWNNANYEIALARYGEARFALPLVQSDRHSLQALVNGVTTLPTPPNLPEQSRNYPGSGYAVLRAGAGENATWLCVKYGPHGGGHGHPDKNSFVLYGARRVVADDPGTANYGVPIQEGWYKTTLAHNTLVVDEANQKPATGACLDFQADNKWSAVLVEAGPALPGVTFRRAAFVLSEQLVVFLDLMHTSDAVPRLFDLAYHPSGAWAQTPPGEPTTFPPKPGYTYLRDGRALTTRDGFTLGVNAAGTPSALAFAADPHTPTTFLTGTGVGKNTEDRVPIVIARRRSNATAYAWAVAVQSGKAPTITAVAVTGEDGKPVPVGEAWAAQVRHENRTYLVIANPGGRVVRAGGWVGSAKLAAVER